MPQKRNSPPKVMTWAKASPALVIAAIFDAVRFMFEWFWFFGPALAAVYCTANVNGVVSTWTVGLLGTKTAAAVCGAGATVVGVFGAPAIAAFGVVMAMATGFAGWLVVGGWIMITNSRIYKENALWFVASLAVTQVPFIGSVPAITGATWKMYSAQIKRDGAKLKKYKEERAAAQLQEQDLQEGQLMQAYYAQMAQDEIY